MVTLHLNIKDLNKLKAKFVQLPLIITGELDNIVGRAITRVDREAKREAPVNKQSGGGNLRQSISSHKTGIAAGVVEVTAAYAAAVHEGTRPHEIRPKVKKALANRRMGLFFGKVVHHPGTKANPFLTRALENATPAINADVTASLKKVLSKK